jgi:glycosyltransferase involved in cell wall biosynthesis
MSEQGIQLSVVIASHNRRELLRRCLDSLAAQTQDPADFEVLVADDGSSDGTAAMVAGLATPYRLRLLSLSKRGQAAAQNAAVEAAAAPVCLTLDDDVVASPTLVAAHLAAHREDPRTIGVGALTQVLSASEDWFSEAMARGWAEHYRSLAARPARWNDCFGANVSLPREPLRQLGGIATDLDSGFDLEVALRLCEAGCVPRFLPEAHGVHEDTAKGTDRVVRDAWLQGATFVELDRRYPGRVGELVEWGRGAGRGELLARRLALVLRVPPAPLIRLGQVLPGRGRKMIWLHFVLRLAVWRGVRANVDGRRWRSLTATRRQPAASSRQLAGDTGARS